MTLTREEFLFILLFVINFVVAVLYLIWGIVSVTARKKEEPERLHDNRRTYVLHFLVMVFCPVIGPLFFLLAYLLYRTIFRFQVNLEDVVFNKDRVRTQIKADEDRERNLIPVEEAVVTSDRRSMRMAMMNIIKGDMQGSLGAIALALDAGDSETAHYAASALSDILNEFRMNVHKMKAEIQEEEPEETEWEEKLLDYMDRVLKQGVFTRLEQNRFVGIMEHTAELLYQKKNTEFTAKRYEAVCLRLLEIEDNENCEKWCLRQAKQYPEELSSFTCRLKLYFMCRNKEAFFRTINELKKSRVVIDSETLEMIRVFN